MKRMLFVVLFSLLLITPIFAELVGQSAPDFTLKGIDDQDVSLSSFKGKIVIVDFWATFCPPCRAEIPGFIEIAEAYKSRGVEVIGISTDKEMDKIRSFVEKNKVSYLMLQANEDVIKAYDNIQAIPTTFILDRNHKIVKKHVGFAEKSVFEEEIKALLAAPETAIEPAPAAASPAATPAADTPVASAAPSPEVASPANEAVPAGK